MDATHFFGKRYKHRGFGGFGKTRFFGEKMVELLPARFQGPPKMGCNFFGAFFSFFVLFLLHLARGCVKKTLFLLVFPHPSKASSDIMQQQSTKPKIAQTKGAHFFSETPFLTIDSKNAPPLKTVHKKNLPKPLFL